MLSNPRRVLVVCSGNTCRSPLAAAILRAKLGPAADVQSAGLETADGSPATKEAIAAAAEVGLAISDHRSRDLRKVDMSCVDVVVAATPNLAHQLRRDHGFLGSLIELNVQDPYGMGIDAYRRTVKTLQEQLESVAQLLISEDCRK